MSRHNANRLTSNASDSAMTDPTSRLGKSLGAVFRLLVRSVMFAPGRSSACEWI